MAPRTKATTKDSHADGWQSVLKGLGRRGDSSRSTQIQSECVRTQQELEAIWSGEGLGCRVVSIVPEDMTRAWIRLPNDADNTVTNALKQLRAQQQFQEALQWTRLFGGALMLLGTTDTADLRQPLSATPRPITFLRVYPRYRCRLLHHNIVTDPRSPYFDKPEFITVQKVDGQEFDVHISRVLTFHGLPWTALQNGVSWEDRFWGMSALQQPWNEIRGLSSAFQAVETLLQEFNIGVFTLSNLSQLLAAGNDKAIYNRIQIINDAKSIINSVLLGENEQFRRDVAGTSGLPELLDRFMQRVSSATGIPVTRLFGTSAAGLNATGDNDMSQYYDKVAAEQVAHLEPNLQICVNRVAAGLGVTEDMTLVFNPLWAPSALQSVEMRNKQANTDKIYMDAGVIDASEVRENRFANGYSYETAVDPNATPSNASDLQAENDELRAQLAALEAQLATGAQ